MQLFPFFKRNKKSASTPFYPVSLEIGGGFLTGTRIDCKSKQGQYNAYINCPPVATLITAKTTAAGNAEWWFGKADGNEENLNDTTRKYKDLFERPNPFQSFNRFYSMAYLMNQLFGKAYIYVQKPVGMARRYATSMLVMPNNYVSEMYDNNGQVIQYNVTIGGKTFPIEPESMMVWNDFTFAINSSNNFMDGQSRLFSLSDPVNTIIAAFEANNVLLTNYGMMGIISPNASNVEGLVVPMNDQQKAQMQDDLQRKYGMMRGQWPFLLTGQSINYQSVSRPTKDLMLFETIQDSTRILTEAYNYPFPLLGYDKAMTENNIGLSMKRLYTNAIVPETKGFVETFNRYFNNVSENSLRFSFDHMPELQANRLENEQALKTAAERLKVEVQAGLTTIEEAKIELNSLKS